eukprot:TRINITY_DN4875_c0_g2_i3.p1 TRINITY_DN4875_c0_g2~~TRINITY_DN4875_c0_g2_i3.p1  ORF type:complete len:291 (-),score=17.07 TRINITY_DN4875_c0_g2_i3:3-875(-)
MSAIAELCDRAERTDISEQGVSRLCGRLEILIHLIHLQLDFTRNRTIASTAIVLLGLANLSTSVIDAMVSLRSPSIHCHFSPIFYSLRHLHLDLENLSITNRVFSLNNLKVIDEKGCRSFCSSICSLKKLTELKIGIYNCCNVTDNMFIDAFDIKERSSISKLELEFGKSRITDAAIQALNNTLFFLPDLKVLILGLGDTAVTDNKLLPLLERLKSVELLPNLKEVAFGFDECKSVTDITGKGIEDLIISRVSIMKVTPWLWKSSDSEEMQQKLRSLKLKRRFSHFNADV